MSCCPYMRISFSNVAISNIGYSPSMRAQFGDNPMIDVYYVADDTFIAANGVETVIKRIGTPLNTIQIDHGGNAIGFVKIS